MTADAKSCPTHPLDGGGPCEPMPSEPWRCVYGEHPVGAPFDDADLREIGRAMADENCLEPQEAERWAFLRDWHRSRLREKRLEAAARAVLFFQRVRVWGRAEMEEWTRLARAAGCGGDVLSVPGTSNGLARLLRAALAPVQPEEIGL